MARSNKKKTHTAKKKKAAPVLTQSAKPAKPLFRLIPLTMVMAGGLLALKTVEIYQTGRSLHEELFVSTVIAQDEPAPAETKAEATTTEPATEGEAETTAESATSPAEAVEAPPEDFFADKNNGFSQREVDVLESLSARREELDALERELALREKVLKATEARIDEKITEMTAMSTELKDLLVTYDKEENAKISSLVKVYEAMKPKDAARIFDELDMDILLMVVDRMSERRVAPVLAEMNPSKAKDVTQQLADQQRREPAAAQLEDAAEPYSPPLF